MTAFGAQPPLQTGQATGNPQSVPDGRMVGAGRRGVAGPGEPTYQRKLAPDLATSQRVKRARPPVRREIFEFCSTHGALIGTITQEAFINLQIDLRETTKCNAFDKLTARCKRSDSIDRCSGGLIQRVAKNASANAWESDCSETLALGYFK